jgi:sulfofructose kinase
MNNQRAQLIMRVTETITPVLCVGAVTLDTVYVTERLPAGDERMVADRTVTACGGPAATAAVTLARLGVPVALAAIVGSDAAGRFVIEALESAGVATDLVIRDREAPTATSTVLLEKGSTGRRIITSRPHEYRATVDPARVFPASPAGWVHVDHAGWAPDRLGARRAWRLSVDGGNPVPGLDLTRVDLYAPTLAVLRGQYPGLDDDEAVRAALGAGAGLVVATDGPGGALAGEPTGAVVRVPGFAVRPVSTLGAGDVFHGGLLAGLAHGLAFLDAVRLANAAAALSCRALDGQSGIPNLSEIEAFIAA